MKAIKSGNKPRLKRKKVTRTNRKGETTIVEKQKVLGPKFKGQIKKTKRVTKISPEGKEELVKGKTKSKGYKGRRYQNGGKTDPPKKGFKSRKTKGQPGDRRTNRDVTSNVMGLPGVRVYSETVRSRHHVYPPGHPRAGHPRVHGPGDTFAPASTIHTKTGLRRKGHGQVSRPEPVKRGKKGGTGARSAGKK